MGKLVTIDCQYLFPQFAASYLLLEGDAALFVECNTAKAVPLLLGGLKRHGISPEVVQYVVVTHAHLDHAGGASALLAHLPNAVLLAHPRTARHMVDPSKLIAGAEQVYGKEEFQKLYGTILPITGSRVRAVEEGEEICFGEKTLRFLFTAGHANHHLCLLVGENGKFDWVFTGDAFGLAYPALQSHGLFIFPTTSPTGFDPAEAKASIQKILASGVKRAFLTHFGEVQDLEAAARQLMADLAFSEDLMHRAVAATHLDSAVLEDAALFAFCEKEVRAYFKKRLDAMKIDQPPEVEALLDLDLRLNAAGIADAALRRRAQM